MPGATRALSQAYYIDVKVGAGGQLAITSFEGARQAELRNIKLEQGKLTATKVYPDGATETFTATFVNRILNGASDFGLFVEWPLQVTPTIMLNRIFYRRY
jgi:hypothetical protein